MSDMKQMKQDIKKLINPELSPATIKTYVSQIHTAYHKMFPEDNTNEFNKDKLTFDNIIEYGNTLKTINSRKTLYSAMMQVVDDKIKKQLLPVMLSLINEYKEQINAGKPSKNMITTKEIKKAFSILKKRYAELLKRKDDLSNHELFCLQKFITIAICAGLFIPPRRNQDYYLMKIKNIDKDIDNYIDHNTEEFVFNSFKTSKSYGQQRVKIPDKLYKLLILYIHHKIKNSDYLISQKRGDPFMSATFTQFINSIFTDTIEVNKISNNSFRHAFLTNKYANTKTLNKDLENMGTSIRQLDTYVD